MKSASITLTREEALELYTICHLARSAGENRAEKWMNRLNYILKIELQPKKNGMGKWPKRTIP